MRSTPKRKRIATPFARNLAKILAERGMSLRAASKIARIPRSVLNDWSAGAVPHDYLAVQRIAHSLGVSFEWLLTGVCTEKAATDLSFSELFEELGVTEGIYKITAVKLIRRKL